MKKLEWHPEERDVRALKIWKKNKTVRTITKKSAAKLKNRIEERGFHDVIVVDTDSNILSGNQRKKALLELGVETVTVLVPNRPLTEDEKDKVALESNLNDGQWNFEGLKSFKFDTLSELGFSMADLSEIWKDNLEASDDKWDEKVERARIKKPITRLGDIIALGDHRLACGDSTDPKVLTRLFGKERAAVIYSDPVYNLKGGVDYDKGVGGKASYGGHVNDNRSFVEYREFLKKSMEAALAVAKPDTHVFYWSDQIYVGVVQDLYRELGIANKRICLWLKNGQNPTPGVAFSKCYEPCTYGVRGRPFISTKIQNLNEVLNKELTTGNNLLSEALDHLDLWAVKRLPGKEMEHATSKPPQLHSKAMRRCSKPGDIILDSFCGSGSTLICGEQLKRRVYTVDLEPVFCDLTIRRFEKLTGKKAKVIGRV
ncbi:ParB N-terminal domain-containing protein [Patescibacteria group bacterium]|nr:ParB N-terminal domain-containing protein [Patescibacteria group bacterium]